MYFLSTRDLQRSSYRLDDRHLMRYVGLASDGLFRLSVGLEHPDDIIDDLDRMLR